MFRDNSQSDNVLEANSHFLKQNGILINQLTSVVNTYDKYKKDVSHLAPSNLLKGQLN